MLIPLIMAGGSGTRFWPESREKNPKQYLKITSDKSMIRMTLDRLSPLVKCEDSYVVTSSAQAALVKRELPDLPEDNIVIEPFGMNTAPAIALSALFLRRKYKGDDIMVVLPSDHVIKDTDAFIGSLRKAESLARDGYLVAFGVKPEYPATGYGYIEAGRKKIGDGFEVASFKEKPDHDNAIKFCDMGNYYWNSGMFVWRLDSILGAFMKLVPELYAILEEISAKWDFKGLSADISAEYSKMPKLPVDIGIMEKSDRRAVIPVDYGWSDVGGWRALMDVLDHDKNGNVILCESESLGSKSNYVKSQKMVALVDVENLVIVDTPDVLLVAHKDSSEKVRDIVKRLGEKGLRKYM
ncbi:MAG: mannose-1-phosphate guanylyltransferase [Victivallales bacterium]